MMDILYNKRVSFALITLKKTTYRTIMSPHAIGEYSCGCSGKKRACYDCSMDQSKRMIHLTVEKCYNVSRELCEAEVCVCVCGKGRGREKELVCVTCKIPKTLSLY